jgi:hypothetical protein
MKADLSHKKRAEIFVRIFADFDGLCTRGAQYCKNNVHAFGRNRILPVLRIQIRDPGSGAFLTPGSGIRDPGWVKSQDPDPG